MSCSGAATCTGSINYRKALSAAKTKTLFSVVSVFGKGKAQRARENGKSSERWLKEIYWRGRGALFVVLLDFGACEAATPPAGSAVPDSDCTKEISELLIVLLRVTSSRKLLAPTVRPDCD